MDESITMIHTTKGATVWLRHKVRIVSNQYAQQTGVSVQPWGGRDQSLKFEFQISLIPFSIDFFLGNKQRNTKQKGSPDSWFASMERILLARDHYLLDETVLVTLEVNQ
jgi:hypothetical protein